MENKNNTRKIHREKRQHRESQRNLPIFSEDDFENPESNTEDKKNVDEEDIKKFKSNENVCSSSDCSD